MINTGPGYSQNCAYAHIEPEDLLSLLHMMSNMRAVICFSLLLSLRPCVAGTAPADEDAIRATIASYVLARNEKAPDRVRSLFTADADQLVSTGEWRHGIDELVKGMMLSSSQEQAKSSVSITDIRLLDSNVSIVDGRYQTTSSDGVVRDMWTTFVLTRTPAGWRIAAIRNMNPSPRHQSR